MSIEFNYSQFAGGMCVCVCRQRIGWMGKRVWVNLMNIVVKSSNGFTLVLSTHNYVLPLTCIRENIRVNCNGHSNNSSKVHLIAVVHPLHGDTQLHFAFGHSPDVQNGCTLQIKLC